MKERQARASDSGALEAVDRILNRGGDADDVLRQVVAALRERAGYDRVAIGFVEGGEEVEGPSAGASEAAGDAVPVEYEGARVATLRVAPARGEEGAALLRRVATLISPYCVVAWDTGGEAWEP